jgi:hypothetical protein
MITAWHIPENLIVILLILSASLITSNNVSIYRIKPVYYHKSHSFRHWGIIASFVNFPYILRILKKHSIYAMNKHVTNQFYLLRHGHMLSGYTCQS